jgi:succinate-semialdehyde dehydrogenase / glutarate-semialdehyde dehydrogenase
MQDQITVDLYIDGKWQPARSGGTITILNPATEEPIATAPQAAREDTLAAIDAAAKGFEIWRKTPAWDRAKVLRKAAMLLQERGDYVARRLSLECGKPLKEAKGELTAAVECIDWFADEARRIYGDILPGRNAHQRFLTVYEPVGVVAAFTAWNFPVVLQARKIAPALAAGCSVVCRPAEEGTGAVAELIKCFIDAGVPAGVVNMLTGHPQEISETVMDSEIVRKVSFTGSIPVGQYFIRRSADTVKKMSMELGGHAPVIIHDDVDPEKAAKIAATGKFRNNGQVCVSPTRFYVHAKHKAAFTDAFIATTKALKLGDGLDPDTEVGPLINKRRLEFIEQMTEDTVKDGAKLGLGGRRPAGMNRGFFFEPTVFTETPDDARVMREEPFGPLAPLSSFETFDEVIERANSLPQGLAAYVFTDSTRQAMQSIEALKVGIVAVNNMAAATAEMPFGGVKHSGFGRENGRQGILDYLDVKFANLVM